MKLTKILPIAYIVVGFVSCPFSTAHAGWFGPSNYDECVLDKMGDRLMSPLQVVAIQDACRNLFPPPRNPPQPVLLNEQFIKYSDCIDAAGNYSICVTDKPSAYKITAVAGYFVNKRPCEIEIGEDWGRWLNLRGKKTDKPDVYTFEIAPGQSNCIYIRFFGFVN